MKTNLKRLLSIFCLTCLLVLMLPAVSMAASAKITFSDPNTSVGQEVNVNMKISADGSLGRADVMLAYDPAALEFISGNSVEGGAGALRAHGGPDSGDLKNIVFSMKFRVLKAGSSQITITSCEVYDGDTQAVTISHQGNSTITAEGAESVPAADGQLASLVVAPGTLTPEFSPAIDTYSIHVGTDVERVEVQALAGEGSAVTVEGNEGLQMGENTIIIKVTASDGITVKNYAISVTKSEGGESAAAEPETVQGVSLTAAAKAITILEPEEGVMLPEGFTPTTIDIDKREVKGWIWASETNHQYCVFYAMNAAGEKDFYRYDLTEKTIQRYFQDPAIDSGISREEYIKVAEDYNALLEDYKIRLYIIIGLAAVSAVLLILVVVLLVSRKPEEYHQKGRGGEGSEDETRSRRRPVSREEQYMRDEEPEEEIPVRRTVKPENPRAFRNEQEYPEDLGYRPEEMDIQVLDEDQNRQVQESMNGGLENDLGGNLRYVELEAAASQEKMPPQNEYQPWEEAQPQEEPAAEESDDDFEFLDL